MKEKIIGYVKKINKNIDNDLLDFTVDEIIDRTKIYLNRYDLPDVLTRVLAKVVNTGLIKCQKEVDLSENGDSDKMISSISDNGQSISFSNEVTKYFTTASDEEIFTGFTPLLNRYRRVKVVHPKSNEENDSKDLL